MIVRVLFSLVFATSLLIVCDWTAEKLAGKKNVRAIEGLAYEKAKMFMILLFGSLIWLFDYGYVQSNISASETAYFIIRLIISGFLLIGWFLYFFRMLKAYKA